MPKAIPDKVRQEIDRRIKQYPEKRTLTYVRGDKWAILTLTKAGAARKAAALLEKGFSVWMQRD